VASNPRIDDLRKRLEKDPGSRLFAQLAEELRKAGDLDEAIILSRDGLQKHPAYPSARMTLGRALFDKGDLAGARAELEGVLKGAADNILASRLLAECLEGLGEFGAAMARYKQTLAMAPGDRQIESKVSALEARLESATRKAMAVPETPPPPVAPSPTGDLDAPIPLVAADEPFELERPYEAGASTAVGALVEPTPLAPAHSQEAEPIPVPEPPEDAEPLTRPVPAVVAAQHEPIVLPENPAVPAVAAVSAAPDLAPGGELFEFDAPDDLPEVPTLKAAAPVFEEPLAVQAQTGDAPPAPAPAEPQLLPAVETEPPPPWLAPAGAPPAPEIISSTLAELYFNQGFTEKAIEVYQQVLGREPGNGRARSRLTELQELETAAQSGRAAAPTAAAGDGRAARRQAIERVIARLEGLRAALRRG
jgi:tetratricopeptide (TPR) repeat protein